MNKWFNVFEATSQTTLKNDLQKIVKQGKSRTFHGSCHCETGIMASIVASVAELKDLLDPIPDDIKTVFQGIANEVCVQPYELTSTN